MILNWTFLELIFFWAWRVDRTETTGPGSLVNPRSARNLRLDQGEKRVVVVVVVEATIVAVMQDVFSGAL